MSDSEERKDESELSALLCEPTAKELYPIVAWVAGKFKDKNYKTVDQWLKETDLSKSTTELCTIIRTTYPARNKLEYWKETLLRLSSELENRGLNSSQILRGLDT